MIGMYDEPGIVTVDLDSTLADTAHRHDLIDRENGTDWHAYSAACTDDTPVLGMVVLVRTLVAAGVEVHALSGRKDSARPATLWWLHKHDIPIERVWLDEFDGDHDHVAYKLARLREIEAITGQKVVLHVDDWAGVAAQFEAEGIPTICVRTPSEIREIIEPQGGLR